MGLNCHNYASLRTCTYIQYLCTHCPSMHSLIMQHTHTSRYFRSLHAAHTRPHPFTLISKQGEWVGCSRWTTLEFSVTNYCIQNANVPKLVGYIAVVYFYLVFVHGMKSFTFLSDLGTFAFHHRLRRSHPTRCLHSRACMYAISWSYKM